MGRRASADAIEASGGAAGCGADAAQEELLAEAGVPTELTEVLMAREERFRAQLAAGRGGARAHSAPQAAARLRACREAAGVLRDVANVTGAPRRLCCEALYVLDACTFSRLPDGGAPPADPGERRRQLLAECLAALRLFAKSDQAGECAVDTGSPASLAFARGRTPDILRWMGLEADEEALANVNVQEMAILQALEWQVAVPTPHAWLEIFSVRFDALTKGLLKPSIVWAKEFAMSAVEHLVVEVAEATARSSEALAAGLFALGMAAGAVLPLDALRPCPLTADEWNQCFSECVSAEAPKCLLEPPVVRYMVKTLEASLGRARPAVGGACLDAALGLLAARRGAGTWLCVEEYLKGSCSRG